MRNNDSEEAWKLVAENQEFLLTEWERIHGNQKMGNKSR